jgi:hypothetical protein
MDDDTRGRLLNKVVNFIPPQLDSFMPPLTPGRPWAYLPSLSNTSLATFFSTDRAN